MDIDEIYYRLKMIGEDSEFPADILARTVARLPADVIEFTLDCVYFHFPPTCNGVAYGVPIFPSDEGWMLRLVYIAPYVFDEQPESEQARVIAHEIAHHWLKHDGPVAPGEAYDSRERQVEELLKAWGITAN